MDDNDEKFELPELVEGELMADELLSYGRQLVATGHPIRATVKGAALGMSSGTEQPLWDALTALLEGRVRGAQLRYSFDETSWIDTVIARGDGRFGLVRIVDPLLGMEK